MIQKTKFAAAMLLVVCVGASLCTATAKGRVPIGAGQIADAITAAGVRVTPSQIELLSSVFAAKANPKLKVVGLTPLDGGLVQARMQCENASICLPFYVLVHWQENSEAKTAMSSWQNSIVTSPHRLSKVEILVHTGKSAIMVFEGNNMRMSLPVVCLQDGGRGQRVRVMNKDTKKIYVARVSGEGQVLAGWGN